jgi:hypothetical protein
MLSWHMEIDVRIEFAGVNLYEAGKSVGQFRGFVLCYQYDVVFSVYKVQSSPLWYLLHGF